jgi:two-component system sensor histidine kinase BaeS
MSDEQHQATPLFGNEQRRGMRFLPIILFILFAIFLCVGGGSALLYWIFSEYSGVRNIWLLLCGAPALFVVLAITIIVTLYTRFGRPVEQIVNAIDSISEGDLSVRVPEDNSPQFQRIIQRFNKMVGELDRAEQQRRNLTADIAHDLRTPLHIIQGNLEGIVHGVYQPTIDHINSTLDETRLLTRLVNDLQILSLAETGQLPLRPTRFVLADLIQDVTSSFSSQAISQGIDLKTNIADPRQELTADYDRLNQVLSNLVSNAMRYTTEGGKISIETGAGSNPERSVRIIVSDSGTGIAPEDLPFIFDRFWRGDRSRRERTHSGLGLAITKQLVHAHHGIIEAQSVVGKGSTFIIELPEHFQANVNHHSEE